MFIQYHYFNMIQYSWDQAYFSDGISISIQHLLVKQIQAKRTREACILKHMSKLKEQKPTERNKISQSGRAEQSRVNGNTLSCGWRNKLS